MPHQPQQSSSSSSSYMREKKVHEVKKTEETVIDGNFQSLRDRFDDEMKKMEDEMARFKSRMADRKKELDLRPMSPITRKREMSLMCDSFDSPLIQDSNDGKTLKLKFDLTDYAPEEIVVKTIDNKLQVHAKHEEKSECRSVFREYNREFLLPDGTNPELIKSSLSREGVLTVEAPLPKSETRRVPIARPTHTRV